MPRSYCGLRNLECTDIKNEVKMILRFCVPFSYFLFEKLITCFVLPISQFQIVRRFTNFTNSDRFGLEFVKLVKRGTKMTHVISF